MHFNTFNMILFVHVFNFFQKDFLWICNPCYGHTAINEFLITWRLETFYKCFLYWYNEQSCTWFLFKFITFINFFVLADKNYGYFKVLKIYLHMAESHVYFFFWLLMFYYIAYNYFFMYFFTYNHTLFFSLLC